MTYFKSIIIGISLSLLLCLVYGCGSSTVTPDPVTPDPYIPEDYGFTGDVSTIPFESVAPKFVENELSQITWATQEDVDDYYTDFIGTLLFLNQGPFEPRTKFVGSLQPLSAIADPVSLVQAAMVFKPAIFEVYSDGVKYYGESTEFTHPDINSAMSISGIEFNNEYLNSYPHYGSSKTYNYALSDAEVGYVNNSTSAEGSAVVSYDFENTKDITVIDSINSVNGALKGSLKVQSSDTNSFPVFRKDGDYIEVPHNDNISFGKEFSAALWIYPDYSVSTTLEIMDKGKDSAINYELYLTNGVLKFQYKDAISGTAQSMTNPALSLKAHEWVHIGISVNPTGIAFYKNGIKVYEKIKSVNFETNTDSLFIGRKNQSKSQRNFYGAMDQITFYNRALTSLEFEAIYNMHFIK